MQKVLGFGGFFFRAQDPSGLAEWYRDHLGIDLVPQGTDGNPWMAKGGPTVFAPLWGPTLYPCFSYLEKSKGASFLNH